VRYSQEKRSFKQVSYQIRMNFFPVSFFLSLPSPLLFFATIDDLYLNILLALFFFSHFLALASTSPAHSVFYSSAFYSTHGFLP